MFRPWKSYRNRNFFPRKDFFVQRWPKSMTTSCVLARHSMQTKNKLTNEIKLLIGCTNRIHTNSTLLTYTKLQFAIPILYYSMVSTVFYLWIIYECSHGKALPSMKYMKSYLNVEGNIQIWLFSGNTPFSDFIIQSHF